MRSGHCEKRVRGETIYLTESGGQSRFPKLGRSGGGIAWCIKFRAKWVESIQVGRSGEPWNHYETTRIFEHQVPDIVSLGEPVYLWKLECIEPVNPPLVIKAKNGPIIWSYFCMQDAIPMLAFNNLSVNADAPRPRPSAVLGLEEAPPQDPRGPKGWGGG